MEEGSHEELLGIKDGVYANLINMQAGREGESQEDAEENEGNLGASMSSGSAITFLL